MATTEVSICNDALIILGAERINSLDDTSKEGLLCKEQYTKVRRQFIASHPWNFAIARAELALNANLPAGSFGWTNSFDLPNDVLRVLETDLNDDAWAIEGRVLFTDSSTVFIKYIKDVTNTALFSVMFEKAFAYELAKRLATSLTQSATLLAAVREDADEAIRSARSFDAQEMSVVTVEADDYLAVRY